jgi:hypothetical protein
MTSKKSCCPAAKTAINSLYRYQYYAMLLISRLDRKNKEKVKVDRFFFYCC